MKITNIHNLPDILVQKISDEYKPQADIIHITDLISPALVRKLKLEHWDEIEDDISNRLWLLLGNAVHQFIEGQASTSKDMLTEERIEIEVDGYKITGKVDLYHNDIITDWKVVSVYSFLLSDKPEWEKQLNAYAWLYRKIGFEVSHLQICAILRDWKKTKSLDKDYPPIPFHQVTIPLWTFEKQEKYILERVMAHKDGTEVCSDADRWKRKDQYAVMSENKKTAVRVFDTLAEAENLSRTSRSYRVERRPGKNIKCEYYCLVKNFCIYAQG